MAYFANIEKITYEGVQSKNPYAFKFYNPTQVIAGKTMEEHLRFGMAYWHTMVAGGADPFGVNTAVRPWDSYTGLDLAKARAEALFELMDKLDMPYFCFHDVDIAPEGDSLREFYSNIDTIVDLLEGYMKQSGKKLLWNTANMFSNPRFMHGAASTSNADVYAHAAAQIKKGLEVGKRLGAENYVFWGGREGYETLLNTDYALEQDNISRMFHMAIDYAKEIQFDAQFLIEPKPKEPTKHQYDFDAATTIAFLQKNGLDKHFKLNLEANHATLAGHNFQHELRVARTNGMLGSLDANQGDLLIGWDTDEFPVDLYAATLTMYEVLQNGGLGKGGVNFDAKVRRPSFEPEDLFLAHIAGMDTFAKGLTTAARLIEDRVFEDFIDKRYSSFQEGIGADVLSGKATLSSLAEYALNNETPRANESGREEWLKSVLNQYLVTE
ncbi:xylose isomerase [Paenibacillus sp. PK4536]|uniref:Xylose isomerase n=2 Tax=Paenibacillus TaxID=44249 RepID=A0A1E3L9X0_9BACL|nr:MULTISPECIES: xylose isomerase [Paenibacillus]MDN4620433.1 xylose isomerase [Paenibacillus sp. PsM32]MDQ1235653.1 xylose isomerase [Paenibacillus sp. SORGH_AS_0306]MDR6112702.1 xylose isomerase [Paenibacillus sp. SORGH_AS_0338]ODP30424.1 Xylose isomerase [Paenibacillus nuruki]WCT55160.1 xylose isomerase [Paenibacillus kyungheensis]